MKRSHTTTHYRACNLCEAICGLAIEVCGDEIRAIRGDRDDPFSRGHICPKAVALQDVHSDPDRLRHPVRRMGDGTWKRLSWDEALDEVGDRLRAVQKASGNDAVGLYVGNPSVHNWGSLLFGPPLSRALRTRNRFSATSVDQLPHHVSATLMFGHKLLLPVPDVDRTQFLLVRGPEEAWWTVGRGRPPADSNRRNGRQTPLHPAGERRVALDGDAAGHFL